MTYSNETFYYVHIERLVAAAFAFLVLLLEFYSGLQAHKVVSIMNNSCNKINSVLSVLSFVSN